MGTRKYKIGIYNDNNEIVAGPYTVEADSLEKAREYAWDLAIGNSLYADEVKDGKENWNSRTKIQES